MSVISEKPFPAQKADILPDTGCGVQQKHAAADGDVAFTGSKAVCRVCKHFYRDPKILPCLHTFCAECIRQLEPFSVLGINGKSIFPEESYLRDQHTVTVLCPECDSEVDLPPSGVDALPTDHLALDEVFLESLLKEDCELVCDLCGEGDAESRCELCCANLCEFCCQAHRRQKKTLSHWVERLQDLKARGHVPQVALCRLHPGERLQLFCEQCDTVVCRECASANHWGHQCSPTQEAASRSAEHIRQLAGSMQPHLGRLEEALKWVDDSQHSLQTQVDAVAQEVRAFARGYARAIETHCLVLLQRLEDVRLQRRNVLHLQGAQLRQALADTRGAVNFAERLLECGSDVGVLSACMVTVCRLERLAEANGSEPLCVSAADSSSICFLPQESGGQVAGYPVVGVIHAKTVDPSKCVIQGEGHQCGWEGQRGEFTLLCRDTAGETMGRGGDTVLVSIVHKERRTCMVEAKVVDNGDGSYGVSYTPLKPGSYSAWICVKAQHVKGSPFVLTVKRKVRRHRGVFHCCSFCSSGGAKEARCGCGGSMPGGYQGCGHGHLGHPGRAHWSCCGSTVEASECLGGSIETGSARNTIRSVDL
uniref:RING-type E3 ubiquitin transferase n=1 Tax=Paramormyrops kingsleyae TaxID=1676925 RepID=A0A3B3QW42_9TELE|nr:tripartite motif-containing protein 45 isoform X1 [Paramormyrops kingsleyae]